MPEELFFCITTYSDIFRLLKCHRLIHGTSDYNHSYRFVVYQHHLKFKIAVGCHQNEKEAETLEFTWGFSLFEVIRAQSFPAACW